uniref:Calcineurin subunit B-like n=1 Tax=Rhizophora mucronata TaxID=61149 RepID=A0A2P2KDE0_RHIMU
MVQLFGNSNKPLLLDIDTYGEMANCSDTTRRSPSSAALTTVILAPDFSLLEPQLPYSDQNFLESLQSQIKLARNLLCSRLLQGLGSTLDSIFWCNVARGLNADKNATKSLKFNPSTILKNLWERGLTANSGTDMTSSAEMKPAPFRSSWQNL